MACISDRSSALVYLWSFGMSPQEIATNARCFTCLPDQQSAILYLLARLAGITDPSVIADQSRCFQCVPNQGEAMLFLADQIATNGNAVCSQDMLIDWTPTNLSLGDMASFGIASSNASPFTGITSLTFRHVLPVLGFAIVAKSSLVSISFPNWTGIQALAPSAQLTITSCPALTSISAPNLTDIKSALTNSSISTNVSLTSLNLPLLATVSSNGLTISGNTALVTLSLPSLTSVATAFAATGNTLMTTLNMPSLVSLGGTLALTTNPALANLALGSYVPLNGRIHTITGAALTDVSVNALLARCVASAAYVTGTVDVSGGTSSAPTGQGIVDKATLQGRGVTVNTN